MKSRHKAYLRVNLISLVFIVVSFISVTLAWFAYSGLINVETEIGVKAWYIDLEKDGETVSNDIVISLTEIYPGMDVVNEIVNIKNLGDSDASVKYSIISARILDNAEDNYVVEEGVISSEYVEDRLSHDYPFHININLTKGYVLSKGLASSFEVSISWPLDSDNDTLDSLWGSEAYEFQQNEENKKTVDPNYQIKPAIQIAISVTAEQYIEEDTSSDPRYNLGNIVLFDVVNNKTCPEISSTCIETYIIDVNNKLGDEIVTLLPNPNNTYSSGTYNDYNSILSNITNGWTVNTRPLLVADLLKVVSTDIMNSFLIRDNISDLIIGNLNYSDRMNKEITRAVSYNGYYNFINEKFLFLSTPNCFWASSEYNSSNGFAVKQITESNSKIYGEAKTSSCNVVPVILVNKTNL
ncbi:MAG: hypothetical protein PHS45_01085 [Bacilli bacterium]|nr:hypothetical protein [Bacilli bacterium]